MLNEDTLKKAREGDQQAIEDICVITWEPVYRYIYFRVQNRQEAEDITQEAFIKVLDYLKKNNIRHDKFISFLKKVALNVLRDKWRNIKRRGSDICLDAISPEESSVLDDTELIALRELIKSGLNTLNEDQRKVIEQRIIQGYSVHDTAVKMNKKEVTVRVLQYRALHTLAKFLGKNT